MLFVFLFFIPFLLLLPTVRVESFGYRAFPSFLSRGSCGRDQNRKRESPPRHVSRQNSDSSQDRPLVAEDYPDTIVGDYSQGDAHIPPAGISVSDEMDASQKDRFVTELVPIKGLSGVAQITTAALDRASFEPVRYLVALSPPETTEEGVSQAIQQENPSEGHGATFVMVDIPPFSPQLASRIRVFMGVKGKLAAILVTSRDSIHYDEAPAIYTTRRADLDLWKQAFPSTEIVAYRLDIPRDCQFAVTQRLDGYGPFALEEDEITGNVTFVETGRPLTYVEWDHDVAQAVLSGLKSPDEESDDTHSQGDEEEFSAQGIRSKEEGKRVLAVYTPGHSFGSVSYVFPERRVCCSGFTIPVEDNRAEENEGEVTGPALDCRGYITTSRGGIVRQMESARSLVNTYADRFEVVLPSRGDPFFVDGDAEERKEELLSILDQYERIGQIYEQLGITSNEDDL